MHTLFAQNIGEISLKSYLQALCIVGFLVVAGCLGLNIFVNGLYTAEALFCVNFFMILYANYVFIGMFSTYKRSLKSVKISFSICYILLCALISAVLYIINPVSIFNAAAKIIFYAALLLTFFVAADIAAKLSHLRTKGVEIDDSLSGGISLIFIIYLLMLTADFLIRNIVMKNLKKDWSKGDFEYTNLLRAITILRICLFLLC